MEKELVTALRGLLEVVEPNDLRGSRTNRAIARAERALRRYDGPRSCPACGGLIEGNAKRVYCKNTCRSRAFRSRAAAGSLEVIARR